MSRRDRIYNEHGKEDDINLPVSKQGLTQVSRRQGIYNEQEKEDDVNSAYSKARVDTGEPKAGNL